MKKSSILAPLLSLSLAGFAHGAVVWSVGIDDDAQDGDGNPAQGLNDTNSYDGTSFASSGVQEIGNNSLPGNPANTGGASGDINRSVDDDYYFAGLYSTVVDGGTYSPVGIVGSHEEYWERALTGGDNVMRFHFNVPTSFTAGDPGATEYLFSFELYNLDDNSTGTGVFDLELFVDGVSMGTSAHTAATINVPHTWSFPVSALGGATEQGAGFDHYVQVQSTASGGARWTSLDYAQLEVVPEPGTTGLIGLACLLPLLRRRRRLAR